MSEWLWFVSRGSGVVSIVLLTVVLVLGAVSSTSERSRTTALTTGLHRNLGLGMVIFLLAHIVTAVADGYVDIGWLATVAPFTSGYETVWVGLGTLAFDLLLAVTLTSALRHRLPEKLWRAVHYATWPLWLIAIAHGFMMGTSDQPVLRGITLACGIIGVGAGALWATRSTRDARRRDLVAAQGWR